MKKHPEILLGFDFGTKRIGVAIGQNITKTARPLGMVKAIDGKPSWMEIAKFVKKWQPDAFVVGIPLNMDGTEQAITISAKQFALELAERFKLPVFQMDERLTSVEARANVFEEGGYKALKKTSVDSVAAQLILQNWLTHQSE